MENAIHMMKLAGFVIAMFFVSTPLRAAQKAVVLTDGAIIYRKPNFDSPVIGYFQKGKKVTVSNKTFGAFYRVRFKQGLTGYISDVDINIDTKSKVSDLKGGKGSKEKRAARPTKTKPPWQAVAFGPAVGMVQFTELINKEELSAKILVYGVQLSIPFTLLEGPFSLTTTLLYHGNAPNYYEQVSTTTPTGKILIFDSVLTFPVSNFSGTAGTINLGGGPLVSYSAFEATLGGQKLDLTETKLGVSILAGLSYRLSDFILRAEAKYFVEKASYLGGYGSVQYVFK